MSIKLFLLLAVVYFPVYNSLSFASDLGYKEGELIVRFAPKADGSQRSAAEKDAIISYLGGSELKHSFKLVPGLSVVKLTPGVKVKDVLGNFNKTEGILYAHPNYIIRTYSSFPNDPNFNQLWGMHNIGQTGGTEDADIDAPEAWDFATENDVIVAVIDSGVDYTHPDLAANMWHNPGEIPGNGIDDDENGFVDDIYGYDFCTIDGKQRDSDPMDDFYHGTHVAGIIGAVGNNGIGITGVCWNVKIMALKFLNWYGDGDTDDAIECIEYAVDMGAKVLNNSWGSGNYDAPGLKDTIEAADESGILFIAAAGNGLSNNDLEPDYPSSYDCDNIISVLSTNDYDEMDVSNYGATSVDLGAPGALILSTFPTYMTSEMQSRGYTTYYERISGTSMAAPHVAGACAFVWSMNPFLNHLQVKNIILNSVDRLESLENHPYLGRTCVTGGRLNLYKAASNNPSLFLDINDNIADDNSVLPDDMIMYTISYYNPPAGDPNYIGTLNNVTIIDYLPDEVDYNSSPGGDYNGVVRTVTWNIGTILPGETNEVNLAVRVNNLAEPMGTIINKAVMRFNIWSTSAVEITDVNAWVPQVIYVNMYATGSRNGMSWKNGFLDLQQALDRAAIGYGREIWVAKGTYIPSVPDPCGYGPLTFYLVNDVPVYGHFAGNETSIEQRNLKDPSNRSILYYDRVNPQLNYVVSAYGSSQNNVIDGFSIIGNPLIQAYSGIQIINACLKVSNCLITDNESDGIYAENSSIIISNCIIQNNKGNGINATFNDNPSLSQPLIENNIIRNNQLTGIHLLSFKTPVIVKNNLIYRNGDKGIFSYIEGEWPWPVGRLKIRNNTIFGNTWYGIYANGIFPDINNCIIWDNGNDELFQCSATYSCIPTGYEGQGNIHSEPCFIDVVTNNFKLKPESPCIDKGDPCFNDFSETDIDGECRIIDGDHNGTSIVDIGADEYYWPKADFDGNEIVNFLDFAILMEDWQEPNEPNKSLDGDDDVDIDDLAVFCDDWLWVAPWSELYALLMEQSQSGDSEIMAEGLTETFAENNSAEIAEEETIEIIDEPFSDEQIQGMIDWTEQLWESNEDLRAMVDPEDYERILESLKGELDQ